MIKKASTEDRMSSGVEDSFFEGVNFEEADINNMIASDGKSGGIEENMMVLVGNGADAGDSDKQVVEVKHRPDTRFGYWSFGRGDVKEVGFSELVGAAGVNSSDYGGENQMTKTRKIIAGNGVVVDPVSDLWLFSWSDGIKEDALIFKKVQNRVGVG